MFGKICICLIRLTTLTELEGLVELKEWAWQYLWCLNYLKKSGIMVNGVKVVAEDVTTQGLTNFYFIRIFLYNI